ncbi:DUF4157 domain-containing protein [Paenibacillus aurantiacus]|uniref:DUF4157 domain-containing protein n=1 Tax=Paenibacillus aurantiacus TaxID=1936118 RepID=A0ABV5KMT4_9BACL
MNNAIGMTKEPTDLHQYTNKGGERQPSATSTSRNQSSAQQTRNTGVPASAGTIAQLQRTVGNQIAMQLMQSGRIGGGGSRPVLQAKGDRTGLGETLKAGIENLSGIPMDDVRVHRNSTKPQQLGALAYAQGTDIHVGPGQEKHLPHEAWHLVQQKQGRVKPTAEIGGKAINDEESLESEADKMGSRAAQFKLDPS